MVIMYSCALCDSLYVSVTYMEVCGVLYTIQLADYYLALVISYDDIYSYCVQIIYTTIYTKT